MKQSALTRRTLLAAAALALLSAGPLAPTWLGGATARAADA